MLSVSEFQHLFLNSPEFRIELVLANNPQGVVDVLVENNYLPDQYEFEEDQTRGAINQLILQRKFDTLSQLLSVVPVNRGALTPNAITALNTLPQFKSNNPWETFASGVGGGEGGEFDWGNMEFWGSIHNGIGGLFGMPGGEEAEQIETLPPASVPSAPWYQHFVDNVQTYILGTLILGILIYLVFSSRKPTRKKK